MFNLKTTTDLHKFWDTFKIHPIKFENHLQGCNMVRKCQKIRKSHEKQRKMTRVRKKLKKKSDFVSSNLPNSLYLKAFNW